MESIIKSLLYRNPKRDPVFKRFITTCEIYRLAMNTEEKRLELVYDYLWFENRRWGANADIPKIQQYYIAHDLPVPAADVLREFLENPKNGVLRYRERFALNEPLLSWRNDKYRERGFELKEVTRSDPPASGSSTQGTSDEDGKEGKQTWPDWLKKKAWVIPYISLLERLAGWVKGMF